MRKTLRTTVAAATMIGAAALAGGAMASPAVAQAPADTGAVIQANGWHKIGTYSTLAACQAKGNEYVSKGWAIRYECRGAYELWVLTNP